MSAVSIQRVLERPMTTPHKNAVSELLLDDQLGELAVEMFDAVGRDVSTHYSKATCNCQVTARASLA